MANAANSLFDAIKKKFKDDPYAERALRRLEEKPESKDRQASVKDVLVEQMEKDDAFAAVVKRLVEVAEKANSRGSLVVGGNIGESVIVTGNGNVIQVVKPSTDEAESSLTKPAVADVSGRWATQELTNPFDEDDKFRLEFEVEVKGHNLLGSIRQVSTRNAYTVRKGILEGKIEGNTVSFYTPGQAISGNEKITYKDYYYGSVSKDEIEFTLQSDRPWGFPPQRFTAKRE